MTVTGPDEKEVTVEVRREYENDLPDNDDSLFYTEKATNLIYEVRFFPDFALVRPAHPEFASVLEKIELVAFTERFEEYGGDPQPIRDFLWGAGIYSIEIEKKK